MTIIGHTIDEVKIMNQKEYQALVKTRSPKPNFSKNLFFAFLSGGTIGLVGEILLHIYMNIFSFSAKEATVPMVVTIVFIACLLTALGIFDKIAVYTGAGTFIPISGFANSLTSAAIEARTEGLVLGVGANMFKLGGTVITFGIVSAFVMGVIRYVFFGG